MRTVQSVPIITASVTIYSAHFQTIRKNEQGLFFFSDCTEWPISHILAVSTSGFSRHPKTNDFACKTRNSESRVDSS